MRSQIGAHGLLGEFVISYKLRLAEQSVERKQHQDGGEFPPCLGWRRCKYVCVQLSIDEVSQHISIGSTWSQGDTKDYSNVLLKVCLPLLSVTAEVTHMVEASELLSGFPRFWVHLSHVGNSGRHLGSADIQFDMMHRHACD